MKIRNIVGSIASCISLFPAFSDNKTKRCVQEILLHVSMYMLVFVVFLLGF